MADKRWQRAICQEVISNGEEAVANLGDDKEVFIIIAINPLTHLIARVEYNVSTVVTVISPGYSTDYRLFGAKKSIQNYKSNAPSKL